MQLKWKLLLLALLVIIMLPVIGYQLGKQQFQMASEHHASMITISTGDTLSKLVRHLAQKNMVSNSIWLKLYLKLHPELSEIKQGTYEIPANASLETIVLLLIQGNEYQFHITFVEGSTFKQWREKIALAPNLLNDVATVSDSQLAQKFGIKQANPEGWFFPETYAYTAGTKASKLLLQAYQKMKNKVTAVWQHREKNLPLNSQYELLILASIIEKETAKVAEQSKIASVFYNRLAKKMRLQTDPTVIYGLGDRYQGDIKRKHLADKNPYNTYVIKGLPPTPIAMPGLSALQACAHPQKTDYLYFVSNGQGEHIFSKTLAQHNKAVAKYQLAKRP